MKVSEVGYVPQEINIQQDGTRSMSGSTSASDNAGSRMVSEQNNNYNNNIMGGRNEQAQVRARNPANMN